MGAKIYDTTSQAWKDATPQIHAGGVWSDTVGKVWDSTSQAWVDAWEKETKLFLYNRGDECSAITNGWTKVTSVAGQSSYKSGTVEKQPDYIRLYDDMAHGDHYGYNTAIKTLQSVNVTNYSSVIFDVDITSYYGGPNGGLSINFGLMTPTNNSTGLRGPDIAYIAHALYNNQSKADSKTVSNPPFYSYGHAISFSYTGEIILNLSGISGSYEVLCVIDFGGSGYTGYTVNAESIIHRVWLE